MPLELETSAWSGEGTFTQLLLERLGDVAGVRFVRVEDAPATRSDADYNFISNELYVVNHGWRNLFRLSHPSVR